MIRNQSQDSVSAAFVMNFRNNNSKWKTYKGIVNNEEKVRNTLEGGTESESGPLDIFISVFPVPHPVT